MQDEHAPRLFEVPYSAVTHAVDIAREAGSARLPSSSDEVKALTVFLAYVIENLREFTDAYDRGYITAADLRKALSIIADEIDDEVRNA